MTGRRRERQLLAAGVGAALLALSPAASAQWLGLGSGASKAGPGELSGGEGLLLFVLGGAATPGLIYAGVEAVEPKVDSGSRNTYIAFTAIGGALGTAGAIYMPFLEGNGPTFGYTLVTGLFWSMAGAGIGGLPQPRFLHASWSGAWAGASTGLGTVAAYRAILSLAGRDDFRGGAGAQLTLGLLGAAGCAVDAAYSDGTERWFTVGCSLVSFAAAVHGTVLLYRRDPPLRGQAAAAGLHALPVPWMDRGARGVALAGTF